jgi:hypothetical protein
MKILFDIISFEKEWFMHMRSLVSQKNTTIEDKKRVLRKALIRVTEQLDIKRQELSAIVGLSESSLSRFFSKQDYYIDPLTKEGELAVLLIRLYRSLDALFGGNSEQCRLWIKNENAHLGMAPIQLIQSIPGLIHTVEYLDAMRGKN